MQTATANYNRLFVTVKKNARRDLPGRIKIFTPLSRLNQQSHATLLVEVK